MHSNASNPSLWTRGYFFLCCQSPSQSLLLTRALIRRQMACGFKISHWMYTCTHESIFLCTIAHVCCLVQCTSVREFQNSSTNLSATYLQSSLPFAPLPSPLWLSTMKCCLFQNSYPDPQPPPSNRSHPLRKQILHLFFFLVSGNQILFLLHISKSPLWLDARE